MFDFDPDEWLFFGLALVVAAAGSWDYWSPILRASRLGTRGLNRLLMAAWPVCGLILAYVVIETLSDTRVRGHFDYLLLFMVGGVAWLGPADLALSILGVSSRDDAIERDNIAAVAVAGGWLIGTAIVYACSNIGGGPTIWTTLVPAAAATVAYSAACVLIELVGGATIDDITIDRDLASGLRLAGALFSAAWILGRAAGGQWSSWEQTWIDLIRFSWPVWPLAVIAGLVHRRLRPTPSRPRPNVLTCGVVPALGYVVAGAIAVGLTPHGFEPLQW
jgi:hypothetical protein